MLKEETEPALPLLHLDDFLPPIDRWSRMGAGVLVGVLLGAVGLAAVLEYNVTVQAAAVVRPLNELSPVRVTNGGTIERILVQENQAVQAGAVIAELGVSDRPRLLKLQTRQQRLQQYLQQYQAQLDRVDTELQRLNTEIVAQSGVMTASVLVDQVERSSVSEADVQVALAQLAAKLPTEATRFTQQRDRLQQQRLSLANQLRYDQGTLQTVNTELSKRVILAPTTGTLFKLALPTVGQPVQPGTVVAQIVPQAAPLVVKARVETQDISRIEVGYQAQLRISAYPYPDYGILTGTVQAIAPDVVTPGSSSPEAIAPYYEITIQPDRPYLVKGDRQYPLQPGMEARADIISREETVLQAFLRKFRLWTDL